jgi:transketolase
MSELKSQRDTFGETLLEIAEKNPHIVAVTADLADSTRLFPFRKQFPNRFFDCGVSEQAAVGIAVGLSEVGYIPFLSSFGVFLPGRALDNIRVSVALNKANVRIIGSHLGFSNHADGATAQAIEDIALMRVLPNMTVLSPADSIELKKMMNQLVNFQGPVYLRMSRAPTNEITNETTGFEIGKGTILESGTDITLIGTGPILNEAVNAMNELNSENIHVELINLSTIKPIDTELILNSAKKTKKVLTLEEHSVMGGLGEAVSHILSENYPVPMKIMGIEDRFGQSACLLSELYKEYHLDKESIKNEIRKLCVR